jgi:SAM-dependent methyltransferase
MGESTRVESYFSGVAARYHQASTSALWRRVRDREALAIQRMLGDVSGLEAVDLGCGAGFYTRLLLAAGARHVVAVDLSQPMLDQLPAHGVTAVRGDATTVDLGRTFQVLVAAGMLEFVPDASAAFRNAAKLAGPGGRLIILFPTDTLLGRAYRRFHRRNGLSIRLFSSADIERLAGACGWRVVARDKAGPYSACARLVRDGGA